MRCTAADVETIEEVVVTAELRAVAVSEVAGSVSLLIPDDRSDVVNHLEEVLARAVNVNFASGASRARFVQMRGIGERGQFAEPLNSSVGLLIDGVVRAALALRRRYLMYRRSRFYGVPRVRCTGRMRWQG